MKWSRELMQRLFGKRKYGKDEVRLFNFVLFFVIFLLILIAGMCTTTF